MKKEHLNELVKLVNLLSTTYIQNEKALKDLECINSVAIVGSSCTGKSRLVDAIRDNEDCIDAKIKVPLRFISRPKRNSDRKTVENCHLTHEEFLTKESNEEMQFSWTRNMERNRTELYGFERVENTNLIVYSGNNALFNNTGSLEPKDELNNIMLLGVYAPEDVRKQRMKNKFQDITKSNPSEIDYRLGDEAANIFPHVHIVTNNYHEHERCAELEFSQFMIGLERIFNK